MNELDFPRVVSSMANRLHMLKEQRFNIGWRKR